MNTEITVQSRAELVDLEKQLVEIIETSDIGIVFQPIISLRDGSVLGYEALSRGPKGTPLQNPDDLFRVARESDKLWELELLCRTKALESANRQDSGIKLFLNVNPHVIHDEKFKQGFTKEYLKKYNINPENIHFEITEKNAVEDMDGFKKTIENYKKQNYKIAIDDAGAGYSGLNMITDIHPHYIKLDMKLIRNIDKDAMKRSLVKSMYDFCMLSNISLIAEGIETVEELNTLIDIGVHFGQGFLIQHPEKDIKPIGTGVLNKIVNYNSKKNHIYYNKISNIYIGNICRNNPIVRPGDSAEAVYDVFFSNPSLTGATVVEDEKVLGIITKTQIHNRMSGQFGYSLHARRPISLIMDILPLIVDYNVPIETVSKLAMSRPDENLYDFIVITNNSNYCGIVTIKNLLEKAMEIEVTNAKHQNPLSGLPGNLIIESYLTKCVVSDSPFTALYLDIDNFKAYNDAYGFENGDAIIRLVSNILSNIVPKDDFVGHIGGDDFVAVLSTYDVDGICTTFIEAFDKGVRDFYSSEDLEQGYIASKNRKGDTEQFPIMAISIAGISNLNNRFTDIYQLTERIGEIKKKCKQQWSSCYIIDD